MAKQDDYRTTEECDKLRGERSTFNQWLVTSMIIVLVSILGAAGTVFITHAGNDRVQDISIGKIETQLQRIPRIEEKIDMLVERDVKKP